MLGGDLYCRITWFHAVKTTQDVDNIAKIILDSLKGVVFTDTLPKNPSGKLLKRDLRQLHGQLFAS